MKLTAPISYLSFEKDFGKINSDNPYVVFLVMEREKMTYGEAQAHIKTEVKKFNTKQLTKKYGL